MLEVNGVGYKAAKSGNKLTLNLGYSHPVEMIDPAGIETTVEIVGSTTVITVKGIDKEKGICSSFDSWYYDRINDCRRS